MSSVIGKAAYDTLKSMIRSNWQEQLRSSVRETAKLVELLDLSASGLRLPEKSLLEFPVKVPRTFIDRIKTPTPDDPVLRQVLPLDAEDLEFPAFTRDPLGEHDRQPAPGLLRKYYGRALLITTGACAVHCRYCFRRYFPYAEQTASRDNWKKPLDLLARDESINEIILSGGDPLILDNEKLSGLIQRLERISHLKRLRIHSRIPVVLPDRITTGLIDVLMQSRFTTVLVIHCNHPNELNDKVGEALTRFRRVLSS